MLQCACGCGEQTQGGKFRPGHDQKLRKSLEEKVGGLQPLSSLVKVTETYALGRMNREDLGRLVKLIYGKD